jgi:crossover junction endodeoxyribonuclease RuvC
MIEGGPYVVLGGDPGASGALAFLFIDRGSGEVLGVRFEDMPTFESRKAGKTHTIMDEPQLAHLIRSVGRIDAAFVEQVGAMPGQGVVSMFKFGYAAGVLRGVLAGLAIPVQPLTPVEWKRAVRLPAGATKDDSRRRAGQLFPDVSPHLTRKKDNGRAEAALIAWAGWLRP